MRDPIGRLMAVVGIAVLGALLVAACGDDDDKSPTVAIAASPSPNATVPPGPSAASGNATVPANLLEIEISDNKFTPSNLTVPVGSKVTWLWTGQRTHSVEGTFNGQSVASEKQNGGSFAFTFATKGTFDYQCGVHGAAMTGKITVQ